MLLIACSVHSQAHYKLEFFFDFVSFFKYGLFSSLICSALIFILFYSSLLYFFIQPSDIFVVFLCFFFLVFLPFSFLLQSLHSFLPLLVIKERKRDDFRREGKRKVKETFFSLTLSYKTFFFFFFIYFYFLFSLNPSYQILSFHFYFLSTFS